MKGNKVIVTFDMILKIKGFDPGFDPDRVPKP